MASSLSLKREVIAFWHATFQSFSFVAPAGDVAILLLGTAQFALGSMPLSVLLAWLLYGLWMVIPYEFSQRIVNAGSYYAYSARANGFMGVLALWFWLSENLTGPAFGVLGLAGFIYLLSPALSSIPYLWVPIAIATLLFGVILSYLGIRPSLSYVMYTGFAEAMFLFISALIIIAILGPRNTIAPFTLAPVGGALAPVFFGMIYSVLDFTGLGTATTVSEEVKNPRRTIKLAILTAWILSGIALIVPSYALTVGWGIDKMSSYATSPDPGLIVYAKYLGVVGWALLVAFTINSYLSYMTAKVNAVTRIWYSAARDGILFKTLSLDKVHPKYGTPYRAVLLFLVLILIINLIAGLIMGPTNAGVWLLTIAGLGIIAVHIVANTALTIYSWKTGELRRNWLKHGLVPTVASIIGLVVFYFSVVPLPPYPFNVAVFLSFAWIALGFLVATYYWVRHKDLLLRAGQSVL